MKIQILSDIHIDLNPNFKIELNPDAEILIVAGDISNKINTTVEVIETLAHRCINESKICKILYVPGNHDFYRSIYQDQIEDLKKAFEGHMIIQFMCNGTYDYNGIHFVGTPLWTDLQYCTNKMLGMYNKMMFKNGMNDARMIKYRLFNGEVAKISPDSAIYEFRKNIKFIMDEVKNHDKNIIITHHAPSPRSIDEKFADSDLNCCFCSECDDYIMQNSNKIAYWIHGHMHSFCDYKIGDAGIICNPIGYENEESHYQQQYVIEV